jgi:hypothetical protein
MTLPTVVADEVVPYLWESFSTDADGQVRLEG